MNVTEKAAARAALAAALPHMGGVIEEMLIAAFLRGESWRKRNDVDRYVAVPEMVQKAARDYADATLSALASHEPAPEPAKDGPEVVERLRKWCSETINQWSDEYEPRENWERQVSGAMREWDKATTEIISDYEALRAENERLRRLDAEYGRVEAAIIMADPAFDGDSPHDNCGDRLIASVHRLRDLAALKGQSNEA